MKKSLLIIAALIISSFVSAQQLIKVENPEPTDREGWIGNTDVTYMSVMENTIMVMAPRQIEPDISGTITSVKFYHYEYEEYNTRSFTLKIYEGIDLQLYDEYMNYYYFESCGNEVYSQDFTVEEGQGWRTVELDTPYNIPEGEFWVGIKMNGEGMMLYGDNANSVRGQYYYSDRYEWVWYWKPSMFMVNWEELLFSNAMAIYVEDGDPVSCNPVQNLEGSPAADAPFVSLDWDAPEAGSTGNLLGYNVYRDDAKINEELITICFFQDTQTEEETTYAYSVEAVYDDGCASQCDPIEVTTDDWGVSENGNLNVKVFPNPAEGFVNVTAEGLQNITLIDMMGRIVKEQPASQSATVVDLSNLPSGLYLLRVTTDKGAALQRLEVK